MQGKVQQLEKFKNVTQGLDYKGNSLGATLNIEDIPHKQAHRIAAAC
jgi:hypothetical protein